MCSSDLTPRDGSSDRASLVSALGGLWLAGVEIDWTQVHDGERRRRVPLPTYPFERRSYWITAPGGAALDHSHQPSALSHVVTANPADHSHQPSALSHLVIAPPALIEDEADDLVQAIRAQLTLMERQLELLQLSE